MAIPFKKVLIPLAVLGVAIFLAFVLIKTKPKAKPVVITEKAWPVQVVEAKYQRVSPELTLYGRLEAQWDTRLSASVAADVVGVAVYEGEVVGAGAVLVRLDETEARLRLNQADARIASEQARHQANLEAVPRERNVLALARKELARTQDLLKKKLASQSALDSTVQAVDRQAIAVSNREQSIHEHDARMAELQAARDQADLDLTRTQVRAPFDGRITRLLVSPGQRVKVGDGLLSIYDTASLLIRAQIPESQLTQVQQAIAAGVILTASGDLDGQLVTASLQTLSGEVAQGGSVAGLFKLDKAPDTVRPGRFLSLSVSLPAHDDLVAMPAEALYGLDRVYVIDAEERLRPRRVSLVGEMQGSDGDSLVLLRSSELKPGERVISTHLPNVIEGLKVQVVDDHG